MGSFEGSWSSNDGAGNARPGEDYDHSYLVQMDYVCALELNDA